MKPLKLNTSSLFKAKESLIIRRKVFHVDLLGQGPFEGFGHILPDCLRQWLIARC